jgi:hypothetical protein
MGEAASKPYVKYADYLELERKSATKLEWLDGVVDDMAGGTPEHAGLTLAVGGELRAQLRGKPCRAFSGDPKIRVLATGLATYPDPRPRAAHVPRAELGSHLMPMASHFPYIRDGRPGCTVCAASAKRHWQVPLTQVGVGAAQSRPHMPQL